jgi:hypothetical protein
VVADATARAVRQAGDGAVALKDAAQVINQGSDLAANLWALRQAFSLAELAWRNRHARHLGGIFVALRACIAS